MWLLHSILFRDIRNVGILCFVVFAHCDPSPPTTTRRHSQCAPLPVHSLAVTDASELLGLPIATAVLVRCTAAPAATAALAAAVGGPVVPAATSPSHRCRAARASCAKRFVSIAGLPPHRTGRCQVQLQFPHAIRHSTDDGKGPPQHGGTSRTRVSQLLLARSHRHTCTLVVPAGVCGPLPGAAAVPTRHPSFDGRREGSAAAQGHKPHARLSVVGARLGRSLRLTAQAARTSHAQRERDPQVCSHAQR